MEIRLSYYSYDILCFPSTYKDRSHFVDNCIEVSMPEQSVQKTQTQGVFLGFINYTEKCPQAQSGWYLLTTSKMLSSNYFTNQQNEFFLTMVGCLAEKECMTI